MSRIYVASNSTAPVIRPIPARVPEPTRTVRIAANVPMPLQVQASIGIAKADGAEGSQLLMEGIVVLPGISATLTFAGESRAGEPRSESRSNEVMLIAPGEWLVASSAAPPARIARNSPLRIQVRDSSGAPLAEACNLGRCEDQPRRFSISIRVPTTLVAEIATVHANCPEADGQATVGGRLIFGRGILVRCTFGEGGDSWGRSPLRVSKTDIVAIEVGQSLRFPDQRVQLSAPTASLRRMTFRDGQGFPLTTNGTQSAS